MVGINCNFGPEVCLKSLAVMKKALEAAGLSPYLITQPMGYFTPEVEKKEGYLQLPEAPFGKGTISCPGPLYVVGVSKIA